MLDLYSKAIFTVIALALSVIAFRGYTVPGNAQVYSNICGGSPDNPCYVSIQTGKYAIDVKVHQ